MTETTAAPAPAEAKPNHGLSVADALAQMQANRASAAAPTPAETAEKPAAEASNPEPGETAEANSVEGEEPEAEATTEETAEETTEEPSGEGVELAEDSKLVLPDGSEWTAKELAEGVLRHKDYTKKTQALAEGQRALAAEQQSFRDKAREFDTGMQAERAQLAEATKAAQAEREKYAQTVDEVEKALNAQGAEWARIDWEAEAVRDPNGFPLKWARYQSWERAQAVTKAEKAELDAKRKADAETADKQSQETARTAWQAHKQALEQHVASQHAELLDTEKGPAKLRAMMATAEAAGMPKEVFIAAMGHAPTADVPVFHPAVFEFLRKATLYDGLVAEQSKVLASDKAPKPDASGKIRVVKAGAARYRPPSAPAAALGRAQAAFNANPSSSANAVALMQAKRAASQSR